MPGEENGRRLAQDGIVILEGAVGSFRCRLQAMQLAISFRASRDFQAQAGLLSNRNMSGLPQAMGAMRTVAVQIQNNGIPGLYGLLETGKGKPLSRGIESIGTRGKVAV
jgi:hypothetical protein